MPFCPKCEQEFRAGFTECHDCGVTLVDRLARFAAREENEERFAEEMFAQPAVVWACSVCLNEFVEGARTCSPCGGVLVEAIGAEAHAKRMTESVLDPARWFEEIDVPLGLIRIHVAKSPTDAAFVAARLEDMGVTPVVGNDVLDDSEDMADLFHVGIYVAPDEVEAAEMLLGDEAADDEPLRGDAYDRLLRRAHSYREIQKHGAARRLLLEAIESAPKKFAAYVALGRLLAATRRLTEALKAFDAGIEAQGADDVTEAKFLYAVYSFLGPAGETSFHGDIADRGFVAITAFSRRHPRHMSGLFLMLEAAAARGDQGKARAARDAIKRVHRAPFKDAGLYSRLDAEIGP